MGEHEIVQLGDVVDFLTGFPFKSGDYCTDFSAIRLLRGDNIAQGVVRWDGVKRWPREMTDTVGQYLLAENDVVLAMDRPWIEAGLKYAALTKKDCPSLLVQRVARFRGTARLDTRFLRYVVGSRAFTEHVLAVQTGTAVPHISGGQIKAFRFRLPPLTEQHAVASVLGALDDKIDLNRRMNETLAATAREIFKDWFVDFGPTRAKMEDRTPYLAPKIWSLFPDRLDNEGKPQGWRLTVLEEVLSELETGGRPKGGVSGYTFGIPSVGAESIVGLGVFDYAKTKYIPQKFFKRMNKGHLKSRDVLLYKDGGRPGAFEPHLTLFGDGFPFDVCAINEHVYRLRANPDFGQALLYFWLSSDLAMEEMRIKGTGVAIPGLNSTQVKSLTTLVPTPNIAKAFDAIADPTITRILANCNEAQSLGRIRDLLLPKLMSGEIRVRDAEKIAEAAQ